ncbi:unnamed protein product [Soboliphyme baturini]|uniref:CID domain-containing protein n=1 Tax=Soboliphyme baturini TaxID=241478 RepID=A0A183IRY6_9BILA|nr:unnamed protein product [Soboliphyme baturini]
MQTHRSGLVTLTLSDTLTMTKIWMKEGVPALNIRAASDSAQRKEIATNVPESDLVPGLAPDRNRELVDTVDLDPMNLIPPRGCAYVVMPDRRSAFKVLDRLRDMRIQNRQIKMAWAPGKGVKEDFKDMWDAEIGVTYIPWDKLPTEFSPLLDGGIIDADSLPPHLMDKYKEALERNIKDEAKAVSAPPAPPAMPAAPPFAPFPPMPGVFPPVLPPVSMFGGMPPPPAVTQLAADSSSPAPPFGGMRGAGMNYMNHMGGPPSQPVSSAMPQFPPVQPRSPYPPMMQPPHSTSMGGNGRAAGIWTPDSANSVTSEHSFLQDAGYSSRFSKPPLLGPRFPMERPDAVAGPGSLSAGFNRFQPPVNRARFSSPDMHELPPPDMYRGGPNRDEDSKGELEAFTPERRQRRTRWSSTSKDRSAESNDESLHFNDSEALNTSIAPENCDKHADDDQMHDYSPPESFSR